MTTTIKIRPHHLVCSLCFNGTGYSQKFIENFANIIQRFTTTQIEIVDELDEICAACPNHNQKKCDDFAKVIPLDNAYSKLFNLKKGDILSWQQAKNIIRHQLKLANFHQICAKCQWKDMGICETALAKFLID